MVSNSLVFGIWFVGWQRRLIRGGRTQTSGTEQSHRAVGLRAPNSREHTAAVQRLTKSDSHDCFDLGHEVHCREDFRRLGESAAKTTDSAAVTLLPREALPSFYSSVSVQEVR